MTTTTYLVTGANRGIGFEIVKKLAENDKNLVFATSRSLKNADALKALGKDNVKILELDVLASLDEIKKLLKGLGDHAVDVVIQNAGAFFSAGADSLSTTVDSYQQNLDVNTFGSIKLYQAVYPYWSKESGATKKFVFISSLLGSLGGFLPVLSYGYGMSKTAVNYFVKQISTEHSRSGLDAIKNSVTIAIHPGLVSTDMGTPFIDAYGMADASVTPPVSAKGVIDVVEALKALDNGTFRNFDGEVNPW